MNKHAIVLYAFFCIVLLSSIAFINVSIDPYAYFQKNGLGKIIYLHNRRHWANLTINRITHGRFDTFFIGNSRTRLGLNPKHLSGSCRPYNASFSGANFENIYTVLMPVIKQGKVKTIVVGLDFGMERIRNTLTFNGFSRAGPLVSLLGFYTTKDALVTLIDRIMNTKKKGVLPDGYPLSFPGNKTASQYRDHLKRMAKSYAKLTRTPMTSGTGWPYFKLLVKESRQQGISLYLFISPFHAALLDAIKGYGLYGEFEDWVRMIVDIAYRGSDKKALLTQVSVWMFCGYNTITTEPFPEEDSQNQMRWYFESSHYREAVGDMILSRLFNLDSPNVPEDFGLRLTPENVESQLTRIGKRDQ